LAPSPPRVLPWDAFSCSVSPVPGPVSRPLRPYTTLFRSGPAQVHPAVAGNAATVHESGKPAPCLSVDGIAVALEVAVERRIGCQDRKSTRLNSSHVKSSYALFCLKKKTTPPRTDRAQVPP